MTAQMHIQFCSVSGMRRHLTSYR